jgi:hypothetical protein
MSKEQEIYKAYQEGVVRASLIRRDLNKYTTEYYPEKVRGLLKAYFATIKEVIKQGEKYLDITTDFEAGLEVGMAIENYRALILKLGK